MKEVWVNQIEAGQDIDDQFVIRKIEAREYNGKTYLSLEFGDKTGRIGGVCWEGAENYLNELASGNIVRVEGKIGTYREMPQISVMSMQKIAAKDFDPVDYLPAGAHDPQTLMKEIDNIIESVSDQDYKKLLTEIFGDGIFRRQFTFAPAAKLWHHSYVGGLAEHTLNVARLAIKASEVYENLDRDLLTSGALLHDIGKAETYSLENFFDFTDEGRLIGHIVIADRIISNKISRLSGFPSEKKKLIRHLVLSHQGTYEQASPVLPQTLEANILYILDLLDSRAGGILKVMGKTMQPGQRWSGYVKLLERYLYLGENMEEE